MKGGEFLDVDPRLLHLPPSRLDGADPAKLQRQIARHGRSLQGMPPVLVYQGSDGAFMITDGVTRATPRPRCAQGCPCPWKCWANCHGRSSHCQPWRTKCHEHERANGIASLT